MHDIRTQIYTHTHTDTHESLWPRRGQDQTRPQPQPVPQSVSLLSPQCALSFELQVKSNEKRTNGNSNKNGKWFFAFLGSGLGPEPGRMSLQGRGRTINKRLTSIDFVAGKGKLVWVCLSTICLAFTSFLVPFPFAFALLSLLCLYISIPLPFPHSCCFFACANGEKLRFNEATALSSCFSSFLPWYICRLWSFKLLSIMHNYLESFFCSLSSPQLGVFVSYFNLIYSKIIAHIRGQSEGLGDGQTDRLTEGQTDRMTGTTRNDRKLHKPSLMTIDCPTWTRICQTQACSQFVHIRVHTPCTTYVCMYIVYIICDWQINGYLFNCAAEMPHLFSPFCICT